MAGTTGLGKINFNVIFFLSFLSFVFSFTAWACFGLGHTWPGVVVGADAAAVVEVVAAASGGVVAASGGVAAGVGGTGVEGRGGKWVVVDAAAAAGLGAPGPGSTAFQTTRRSDRPWIRAWKKEKRG